MNTGERDGTTYHAKEWQELMDRNQFDSFIDKEIKAGRQKTGHRPLPPAQPLAKTRNA
ncbi:MAG: hypothetical protein KGI73_01720 [Patescibacteria group bacterium]|nr:hypothetical protein [Patescibacteria group bacterium]